MAHKHAHAGGTAITGRVLACKQTILAPLVVLLALLAPAPAGQQHHVASATAPETIVFSSTRTALNKFTIHRMDPDGSGIVAITSGPGIDLNPRISPDGKKIAFTRVISGNWEVFVMNADGTAQTNVSNDPGIDEQPSWSADSQKLAFTSNRGGTYRTWLVNADGTNLVQFNDSGVYPAWSPDGSIIAYVTGGGLHLYLKPVAGGVETQVIMDPDFAVYNPEWSPDGSKVAFHAWDWDADHNRIFEVPAAGGTPVARTDDEGTSPDYSPDGANIVFESERDGTRQLYTVDTQGVETPLADSAATDAYPDWGHLEAAPPPAQGNVNCDGSVTSVDALQLLRHVAGMSVSQPPGCPEIGSEVASLFGDVDCSGGVTSVDALKVLRYVAGLPVAQTEPCPDIDELEAG